MLLVNVNVPRFVPDLKLPRQHQEDDERCKNGGQSA